MENRYLTFTEIRDPLKWIRSSYVSGLPIDAPGNDSSVFKGMLVDSMKIRMTQYANELLKSIETAQAAYELD